MSTVQALTELSHRADEVAAFCRETGEPIQVTHLAGDDLVLMSVEAYRRQRELAVSEARRQAAEEARRPLLEAARRLQIRRRGGTGFTHFARDLTFFATLGWPLPKKGRRPAQIFLDMRDLRCYS